MTLKIRPRIRRKNKKQKIFYDFFIEDPFIEEINGGEANYNAFLLFNKIFIEEPGKIFQDKKREKLF